MNVARLGSILLLGLGLVLWPSTSRAQQSDKIFHLGWLGSALRRSDSLSRLVGRCASLFLGRMFCFKNGGSLQRNVPW
jgi:hypothetical protein